jgi:hypothetical protein
MNISASGFSLAILRNGLIAQKRFHRCICLSVGFTHVKILFVMG